MSVSSSVAGTGVLTKGVVAPGHRSAKGDDPRGSDFAALMRSGEDGGKTTFASVTPSHRHGEMRDPEQTSNLDGDLPLKSDTSQPTEAEAFSAMPSEDRLAKGGKAGAGSQPASAAEPDDAQAGQAGPSSAFDQTRQAGRKADWEQPAGPDLPTHGGPPRVASEPDTGLSVHGNPPGAVETGRAERHLPTVKTPPHTVADVPAREDPAGSQAAEIQPADGKFARRDGATVGKNRDTANDPDAVADDAKSDAIKADEAEAQNPAPVVVTPPLSLPTTDRGNGAAMAADDIDLSAAEGASVREDARSSATTSVDPDAPRQTRTGSSQKVVTGQVGLPQSPATQASSGPATVTYSTQPAASAPTEAGPAPVAKEPASPPPTAFRTELTMAAANYAILASNARTAQGENPRASAPDAGASEGGDPVRISVLPTREPMPPTPVVITSALAMPVLPSAVTGGEVPVKAAALAAGASSAKELAGTVKPQRRSGPDATAPVSRGGQAEQPTNLAPTQPMSGATATVVSAIASEPSWRPAPVSATSHLAKPTGDTQVKTLSIQLHPAELGVVTATLKLVDDQLTVEISANTQEARARLSSDTHTIAKSLRALGFDVDQVTIMQPTVHNPAPSRADDATGLPAPTTRDQQAFGGGAAGGSGGRLGGQQTGRNGDDTAHGPRATGSPAADGGSSGLYI